jgi:hypothetical protein
MEMPMRFIVDADLPANVQSVSLSYALFDVTQFASAEELNAGSGSGGPRDNQQNAEQSAEQGAAE